MISKILFGVILSGSIGFYLFYTFSYLPLITKVEQQQLVLQAQELRQQEQIATIDALQNNLTKTSEALSTQSARNSEIEGEMSRYMNIFRRHNLSKLAAAKPGLIEPRINKGTKNVFDSIEEDSAFISNLN